LSFLNILKEEKGKATPETELGTPYLKKGNNRQVEESSTPTHS